MHQLNLVLGLGQGRACRLLLATVSPAREARSSGACVASAFSPPPPTHPPQKRKPPREPSLSALAGPIYGGLRLLTSASLAGARALVSGNPERLSAAIYQGSECSSLRVGHSARGAFLSAAPSARQQQSTGRPRWSLPAPAHGAPCPCLDLTYSRSGITYFYNTNLFKSDTRISPTRYPRGHRSLMCLCSKQF